MIVASVILEAASVLAIVNPNDESARTVNDLAGGFQEMTEANLIP